MWFLRVVAVLGLLARSAAAADLCPPGCHAGAPCSLNRFGVNDTYVSRNTPAVAYDWARSFGFGWIRVNMAWSELEPSPGSYNWAAVEPAVNLAVARGFSVLAVFRDVPTWANSGTGNPKRAECVDSNKDGPRGLRSRCPARDRVPVLHPRRRAPLPGPRRGLGALERARPLRVLQRPG